MKKIISIILLLTVLASLFITSPVLADDMFEATEYSININGKNVNLGNTPIMKNANGSTFIPLRAVLTEIGCTVDYQEDNIAKVQKGITAIYFRDDDSILYTNDSVNGPKNIDTNLPVKNVNGSLYVPLRSVLEALFCKVDVDSSDSENKKINITSNYTVSPLNHDNYLYINRTKYANDTEETSQKFVFDLQNMRKVDFKDENTEQDGITPENTEEVMDLLLSKDKVAIFNVVTKTGNATNNNYFIIKDGKDPEKCSDVIAILEKDNKDVIIITKDGTKIEYPSGNKREADKDISISLSIPYSSTKIKYEGNNEFKFTENITKDEFLDSFEPFLKNFFTDSKNISEDRIIIQFAHGYEKQTVKFTGE